VLRKKIFQDESLAAPPLPLKPTLDLAAIASFEVTSEANEHPLDHALDDDAKRWVAGTEGAQKIRLTFDEPRDIRQITLRFEEEEISRTQEISLHVKSATGDWRELRRQQFNFSPPTTAREVEKFDLNLAAVAAIELRIVPEIGGGGIATLTYLGIA